jgi:hypothetical protein
MPAELLLRRVQSNDIKAHVVVGLRCLMAPHLFQRRRSNKASEGEMALADIAIVASDERRIYPGRYSMQTRSGLYLIPHAC